MRFYLLLWLFISPVALFAQANIALINDPDGFTNVRKAPGTSAAIAGKLSKDDLFYCEPTAGEWWKISRYGIEGYVHRSRIRMFADLPDSIQKDIFRRDFLYYGHIAGKRSAAWSEYLKRGKKWKNAADSLNFQQKEDEILYEKSFLPLLHVFPPYFCKTADTATLRLLFDAMLEDTGSADEMRDFTVGECYICRTEDVLKVLGKYSGPSRSYVFGAVEYGLMNILNEKAPDFKRLSKRLSDAEKTSR